ncbi:MAG: right-handed parallel beta-helix repeat-containing protein [Chloroflexi bacterium]|nr:right-handed parallel beta-helix repeat-containing protein [Chloroflexota bacterium]
MSRRTRLVTIASTAALLIASMAVPASAGPEKTTRWVDDDGKAGPNGCGGSRTAFTSVQAAITASDRNDVVIVCPGTYTERLEITGDRHGLTVRASGKWTARIRAPRVGETGYLVRVDGVQDVTLQHLELVFPTSGSCLDYANAISVQSGHGIRILGNHIRPNGSASLGPCGYADGIDLDASRRVRISSNLIRDFRSDGITIDGSRGVIHGNAVRYLHAAYTSPESGDQGIEIDGSRFRISANVVRTRDDGSASLPYLADGIDVDDDLTGSVVRDNVVRGAWIGIQVSGSGATVLRNRATRNLIGIAANDGGNTLRGNDARGNLDFDCYDATIGSGTAGTDNTWKNNQGNGVPFGICAGDLLPT